MVREIPLTRGMVALVDDEDYERVACYRWGALDAGRERFYARRATNRGGVFKNILLHRFLLDAPDGVDVDHEDGDGLNCRRSNIRLATERQNTWNAKPKSGTASAFKGVITVDSGETWKAIITKDGRPLWLGTYDTEEQAARVYDAAAVQLREEFAWTNFPDLEQWAIDVAATVIAGGRAPRKPRALRDDDVRAIRSLYAAGGVLMREIADQYEVCVASIGHAIKGYTFRHITDPAPITNDKRRKAE